MKENDKDALFKKAIGYGIHNLKFDDIEIIMFKQLPSIQKQFEDFRKSLPKEKLKGWTLKRFLNRKPFTLE